MEKTEKVIIIGSGPAGLTAAIYAARGNLDPLVISGREVGGQLMETTDVDDFPGFPTGIQGPELIANFRAQAERFETRFLAENVISVDFSKAPFTIKTETQVLAAHSVILATGASAMWLGLPSEQKLRGRGVSACAVCDGPFFRDKKVMIVGGGDAAMREAQHLSKYCREVIIVHRREVLKAQKALQELVKSKPNISFIYNSVVEEILGEEKVTGVKIKNVVTGKVEEIAVDGVFVAIGHKPNTDFLQGQLELNERGYVVVKDETMTSVSGIFVAGDVADWKYRQAVTAAGSGCKATLDVEEYLSNQKIH